MMSQKCLKNIRKKNQGGGISGYIFTRCLMQVSPTSSTSWRGATCLKFCALLHSAVMRARLRAIFAKIHGPNFQRSKMFEFHREITLSSWPSSWSPYSGVITRKNTSKMGWPKIGVICARLRLLQHIQINIIYYRDISFMMQAGLIKVPKLWKIVKLMNLQAKICDPNRWPDRTEILCGSFSH